MKTMLSQFASLFVCTIIPTSVFAHGEEKLGPNGGYIKMPGAFHTEVVADSKNTLKVYLLDMEWKNPSVANSSVKASISGKPATQGKCEIKENFYLCQFAENVDLSRKAKLKINSQREGQKGMAISYSLPLKLDKGAVGHEGHH
jgi:hypothetical protein